MKFEPVFFSNGIGARIRQDFDRDFLKLGRKVFAVIGSSGEVVSVTKDAIDGAEPMWVKWISPSEWYVKLQGTFVIPESFIERVTIALQSEMSEDDIRICMTYFQSQFRPEYQHLTSEWERSPLSVIFTVLERLDLLEKVRATSFELTPLHYEELASYLMLTCFDRLGQPADWIDFGNWLLSSNKKEEREAAVSKIQDDNLVSAAAKLQKSYTEIYGVKNSFFHFVREMLSTKSKIELFESIDIVKNSNPPNIESLPPADEDEKLKYLFKRRNDYTHKAAFSPPSGTALLQIKSNIVQEFKANQYVTTRVLDWPNVLERAVRNGLAFYIKRNIKSVDSK